MMSLSKEELVLAACLLETTDASLSAEDAMSDVKQIMMNLPESLDPAYRGLLAKAACHDACRVLIHSYPCLSSVSGRGEP